MTWWRFVPILVVALALAVWNAPQDPVEVAAKPIDGAVHPRPVEGQPVVFPEASDAELRWGAAFFEDSARWVAGEGAVVERIETFHCRLDVKLEGRSSRLEGPVSLWYRAPGSFRLERESRAGTTTHILAGERGWLIHPDSHVEDLSASRAGRVEMADVRVTRDRFVDVLAAVTLLPMRQGSTGFSFAGYKRGSGTYAGNWIKLVRQPPGTRRVMCWLAYDRSDLDEVHTTWPGIVRVEDEGERGAWTEDLILKEWDSPLAERGAGRRFPRRIEAYAIDKSRDRTIPRRFLFAIVDDLQVNVPLEERLFEPPAEGE